MATPIRSDRVPAGYRTFWAVAAGVTVAGATFSLTRELPWESILAVFLTSSLLAASCALSAEAVTAEDVDLKRAGTIGALAGAAVLVLVGMAFMAGSLGALWWAGMLVLAPGALGRVGRWFRTPGGRRAGGPPVTDDHDWLPPWQSAPEDAAVLDLPGTVSTAPDPEAGAALPAEDRGDPSPDWSPDVSVTSFVTDEDLCLAWESSGRALSRCGDAELRQELVRVRQACLDELERRQPEAVRAWLESGADVETGPVRFLPDAG